jgi:hypothetical protein
VVDSIRQHVAIQREFGEG